MAILTETNSWSPNIYGVDYYTPVLGGLPEYSNGIPVGGFANVAAQQLANRTVYLLDRLQANDLTTLGIETDLEAVRTTVDQHIGSRGDVHGLATQTANGFMSAADKYKLNHISTVATSGSYNDLTDKPPLEFFVRFGDFEARAGERYYIMQNLTVTLGDPSFYGLVQGDYIAMSKSPTSQATVQATAGVQIITSAGTDDSVVFDVDDEIIFVFDGTNWRV